MSVYLIADTHFGDGSILRYESRPFEDAAAMDAELIRRWNQTVTPQDTVYHLGDFSRYDLQKNREILAQLNGTKYLVLGNHDRQYTCRQWQEAGFAWVYDLPVLYEGFYVLSHEPIYVSANMPYANLFGHVHASPTYKTCSCRSFCVSVERIDYAPIAFTAVKEAIFRCIQQNEP